LKLPLAILIALILGALSCSRRTMSEHETSPEAAPPTAEAHRVAITVDTKQAQGRISRYLTGMHFVYAFERDALYKDERIAQWMQRSKVGIIRWPGGTAVQYYHWDDLNGIAFEVDRWDPTYNAKSKPPSQYMDLDEYIAFCQRIKAEPMVGINIRSGKKFNREKDSLDSARRLVQYCKDKRYGVKHWYIGNECFIGWSPSAYAKAIDRYAEVIKSVDPNVVIIGDWKFGPEAKNRFGQALLIGRQSKHIDVMEIHEKWGNRWGLAGELGHHTFEDWQREPGIYNGKLRQFIEQFHAEMKAADKDVQLGFNEWGVQLKGDPTLFEVALVKADYLIEMFRHPIYSACDWNLNMGPGKSRLLMTRNDRTELVGLHPATQVFEMVSHAMGEKRTPINSDDKLVYGFVSLGDEGRLQVYLLNKRSTPVAAEIHLDAAPPADFQIKVTSFVSPGKAIQTIATEAGQNRALLTLPPLSFSRIVFTLHR
jgi:alpha-N-arabinofuranosidase